MTVEDIESAIARLAPEDLDRFRAWFASFDAKRFDDRIEADMRSGKLDSMADEALAEHRAGNIRAL